jgi:hypothetical protein
MRRKPQAVQRPRDFMLLKIALAIGFVLFMLLHHYLAYRRIVNA